MGRFDSKLGLSPVVSKAFSWGKKEVWITEQVLNQAKECLGRVKQEVSLW